MVRLEAYMNGVVVGELPTEDYDLLKGEILKDWKTHIRQAYNIIKTMVCLALKLIYVIPLAVFWGMCYLAIWEPDTLRQVLSIAQTNPTSFARQLLSTSVWMPIYVISVLFLSGLAPFDYWKSLGFRNVFGEEINDAIRRKLKIATTGDVTLAGTADYSILGLPCAMAMGYFAVVGIFSGHLLAGMAAPLIAHAILYLLYRNGKLDGFLVLVDKQFRHRGKV